MTRKIQIFDTTLRDGEQCPGASMRTDDKLIITRQLLRLGVDVIEAGFPASSPGDFASVQAIAGLVGDAATVCALTRALPADIEAAAEALKLARRPRIHTGIGVSPYHLHEKLRIGEDEAVERAVAAVKLARRYCDDVEFYAEDAGRSDRVFLARMLEAVIAAGATVVNVPETTGFSLPSDFGARIAYLMENVRGIEDVCVSVHCHNDLGLATALTLEGIRNGATQIECTINGIGERAGNTALEEVVMAIALHGEELDAHTDINTRELQRASRTVASVSGLSVQRNKAIVGANAFAHASGIHQDGVLKARDTYEIIDPVTVGFGQSAFVLTARSGRAALQARLEELGHVLSDDIFEAIYQAFLQLADRKKEVYDDDLLALVAEYERAVDARYTLEAVQVSCGYPLTPTATLRLRERGGEEHIAITYGTGPIDAAYRAVDQIVGAQTDLTEFAVQSITRGIDAMGEVTVRVADDKGRVFTGRAADGDIIVSSTRAYLNALNRLLAAE